MNIDTRTDALRQSLDTPEHIGAGRFNVVVEAEAELVKSIEFWLAHVTRIEPLPRPPVAATYNTNARAVLAEASRVVTDESVAIGSGYSSMAAPDPTIETSQQHLIQAAQQAADHAFSNPLFESSQS